MSVRSTTLIGLAALLAAPAVAMAQEEDSNYGTYTYVRGQRGDQPVPEENLAGQTVETTEDRIALIDPEGNESFVIFYTVDDSEETIKIAMEIIESTVMEDAIGSQAKGLVKLDGDEVTLIYDYESGDYPDDFEPDGPAQHLFVLKKKGDSQ